MTKTFCDVCKGCNREVYLIVGRGNGKGLRILNELYNQLEEGKRIVFLPNKSNISILSCMKKTKVKEENDVSTKLL